jgi:hypothetical protein
MVCVSWLAVRPKSGRRDRPERLGAVPETDGLWGGSIVSVSFDPVAWTLQFGVAVVVGQARHRYELVLDGVSPLAGLTRPSVALELRRID